MNSRTLPIIITGFAFVGMAGMLAALIAGEILRATPSSLILQDAAFASVAIASPVAAFAFYSFTKNNSRMVHQGPIVQAAYTSAMAMGELPVLLSIFAVGRAWPIWFALIGMIFTVVLLTPKALADANS